MRGDSSPGTLTPNPTQDNKEALRSPLWRGCTLGWRGAELPAPFLGSGSQRRQGRGLLGSVASVSRTLLSFSSKPNDWGLQEGPQRLGVPLVDESRRPRVGRRL